MAKLVIKTEKTAFMFINVYSPNDLREKIAFYDELHCKLDGMPCPGHLVVMGDFNFVEHRIDWSPVHKDDDTLCLKFNELKSKLKLRDAWWTQNGHAQTYTYRHVSYNSLARIDCMYATKETVGMMHRWTNEPLGNLSDHNIVTCAVQYETDMYWHLPAHLLNEPCFVKAVDGILKKVETAFKENPKVAKQAEWNKAKDLIAVEAVKCVKIVRKSKTKAMRQLGNRIDWLSKKSSAGSRAKIVELEKERA